MFKRFLLAALSLCVFATSAQATTLNLVFLSQEGTAEHEAVKYLKHYVEARTNNELTIEVFQGAQLCGNAPECFQALMSDTVNIYTATAGGLSVVYPEVAALNLPYMIPSEVMAQEMLAGTFENDLRKFVLEGTNNQFLMMSLSQSAGWRSYANTKKEVKSPADLKGMKLRTVEDQVQMEQVRLHGASPTPIPFMEVYDSLSKGVVDGSLNSITDIVAVKLHEKAKFITLDGHNFMFAAWFMNANFFKGLSRDFQLALIDGFKLMGTLENGVQMSKELPAYAQFAEVGGKLYVPNPTEKQQFIDSVAPLRKWYTDTFGAKGQAFLDMIDKNITASQKLVDARYASFGATLNQ